MGGPCRGLERLGFGHGSDQTKDQRERFSFLYQALSQGLKSVLHLVNAAKPPSLSQNDLKEKSFLFFFFFFLTASVYGLETHSLLEQDVWGILENHDCVSHFAPRPEYSVKHFAATHWRKGLGHHQLFPEMHTPGRNYPGLFSRHGGLQEMLLSLLRFSSRFCKAAFGVWPFLFFSLHSGGVRE